jgi:cysteinyl-tRNA synthetase
LDEASVEAFTAAMDADFNTPDALAVIFELARTINTQRALLEIPGEAAGPMTLGGRPTREDIDRGRRTLVQLLDVLGLDIESTASSDRVQSVAPYIELMQDISVRLRGVNQSAFAEEITDQLAGLADVDSTEHRNGQSIGPYVRMLLDTRRKLRDVKQWALADEIRQRLTHLGVIVEDKPGGESTWRIER